jgi:tetratricopeptide (TPR) repeat protein
MLAKTNNPKAIELLNEAIEIDPLFVDSYVRLGGIQVGRAGGPTGSLSSQDALKLALPPIKKALEINPDHPGAHRALGDIKYLLEWDFSGAEKEYLKAYELSGNPSYMNFSLLIQNRRFNEALQVAMNTKDHDPFNMHHGVGLSYAFLGEYSKALDNFKEQLELNPDSRNYYNYRIGWIYMGMKEYGKAIQKFEYAIRDWRIPFFMADLVICYKLIGEEEKHKEILNEFIDKYNGGELGCLAFLIGKIYSGIGDVDQALEWLEKSYQDRELEMIWLYADPAFETLQDNEQYNDLLKRVGFDV